MRTQEEIAARAAKSESFFGFALDVLVPYLDFDRARPFLQSDVTAESWAKDKKTFTREGAIAELADYMEFAWGKVQGHRGISADRSVQKCTEWLWLLCDDEGVRLVEEAGYAQYGAPKLAVICRRLSLPIPDDSGTQRMIEGRPCEDGCEAGCGS